MTNTQRKLGIGYALRQVGIAALNLGKTLLNLAAQAAIAFLKNPILGLGIVAGATAAGFGIKKAFSKADDLLDDQHSGKKAFLDKGSITVLNDQDKGTFVATTNETKNINTGGGTTTNMSDTNDEIKKGNEILAKLLNKEQVVVETFSQNFPTDSQRGFTSFT